MKTLSQAALTALTNIVVEGQTARIAAQLPRKLYLEVNAALEALGGKWSRKLEAHTFDGRTEDDIRDALEDVVACGGFVDKKQDLGQFFTPAGLAARIVALADIKPGMVVLEPSAGFGHIVDAITDLPGQRAVTAFEIDPITVADLRTRETGTVKVFHQDFLALKADTRLLFDRIVMNPPFRRNADIDHVLHAWKFLKPGGRLVSVMASGVMFRQDAKATEFRLFVRKHVAADVLLNCSAANAGFIALPAASFASAGTQVNTVIVVLDKSKASITTEEALHRERDRILKGRR